MGAAQTVYNNNPTNLSPGKVATLDDFVSESSKNTTGVLVPFGLGVVKGSADDNFALPSSKSDKFLGIVLASQYDNASNVTVPQGSPGVAPLDIAAIGKQGVFMVAVEAAVTKDSAVFCRITTHGGLTPGNFRGDADQVSSTDTAAIVAGCRFLSSTSGAGNALVEVFGQLGLLS